ncbi:MAG: DUF2934 domain-containing protein [Devosia sp.]
MGDREDAIRARAYALWMESGRPESAAMEFWLEAERQVDAEHTAKAETPRSSGVEAATPTRSRGEKGS